MTNEIAKGDDRFKCQKYKHVWPTWEQGNKLMGNGTLPGEVCQCGEKIIIERICSECLRDVTIVVKVNSKEHGKWQNLEE